MNLKGRNINIMLAGLLCLAFRLVPGRPPNFEPILTTQMPIGKTYGGIMAFFFGVGSILLYDFVTGTWGLWTLITAPTYGALGFMGTWYLKKRDKLRHMAVFAVFGTLFYDAITGLSVGPLIFGQPFMAAFLGQIPFTLMHLLGNVSLSLIWSPLVLRFFERQSAVFSVKPAPAVAVVVSRF